MPFDLSQGVLCTDIIPDTEYMFQFLQLVVVVVHDG